MKKTLILFGLSAAVVLSMGCESDQEASELEDNASSDAVEATPTLTYTLTLNDWLSADPLEGAEVCTNIEDVACVTSDAAGQASITASVTEGQVVELTVDLEGYFPITIQPVANDVVDGAVVESTWVLAPLASLNLLTGALGIEIDDLKGQATVSVVGPANDEGVRASVVNAHVSVDAAVDVGPKYLNAGTEITTLGPFGHDEDGTTPAGPVGFFNIAPGTVNFTVTAPGLICGPGISGMASEEGTVSGTITEGRVTYFFVSCEEDEESLVEVTSIATISDWTTGDPLEGVALCLNRATEDCLSSDADGQVTASARVADGQIYQLRADKEGFFPFFAEGVITTPQPGDVLSTNWVMAASEALELLTAALETELDEEKGHVTMVVFGPADDEGVRSLVSGAVVTSDANAEFGPKYLNAVADFGTSGIFAEESVGTTANGAVSFFNVSPGRADFTVEVPGHICGPGIAGLPSLSASTASHIEAGRATYMTVACEVAEE